MVDTSCTYQMPKHGWVCYFCGDKFTTPGAAEIHFGSTPFATAACKIKAGEEYGLLMDLRKVQKELEQYYQEDSAKDREMAAMVSNHAQALIREEEIGYDRGLADGREDAS